MAARFGWDDFVLDLDAYRLERAGRPLPLEPKALDLLALMVQRPGHLFTKQEIFTAVWADTAVTDHALTRVVAQLRRALGDEAREARYIETVPTRGYRWIRPVATIVAPAAPAPEPAPAPVPATAAGLPLPRRGRRAALLSLGVAAVIVATLAWNARRGQPAVGGAGTDRPGGVAAPVQLTTHDGLDMQPSLSPQGDALAFTSDVSGAFEIYVQALDGTATATALTRDGGHNVQPAWSPDGRAIAYHSYRLGGIWIVPSRGGVPRQVVAEGSNPVWSPDGRRLAYQSDEHSDVTPSAFGAQSGSTIRIVDVDGGQARELTRGGQPIGGHAAPAWSPDGRYLAFTVFEGGPDGGAWLYDVRTGDSTQLEAGPGLFEPVFAPDGSAIYIAGGEPFVVRLPFDPATGTLRGPRETIPVAGVPGVRGLSISADGRQLAFGGVALDSQIWTQAIDRLGNATGPPRALTSDTSRRNSVPVVSPDGTKVAYASTRRGSLPNVWVMDADGRNRLQVTPEETADWNPAWFPDGRRLAYSSVRAGSSGIWTVDIDTRRGGPLFDPSDARTASPPAPRPSGRLAELGLAPSMTRAAFSIITPPAGRRILYVAGFEPFAPRALTDGSTSVGYPAWSPDERRLAVEIKDGSSTHAGVVEVATGVLRQLTRERGQTWVRSWSPDGRRVASAVMRAGVWSLRWIEADTGRQGEMSAAVPPRAYVRYPAWSPRGDAVFYERGELRGNVWLLPLP